MRCASTTALAFAWVAIAVTLRPTVALGQHELDDLLEAPAEEAARTETRDAGGGGDPGREAAADGRAKEVSDRPEPDETDRSPATAGTGAAGAVAAQRTPRPRMIEEIIVTAQRKEQSLRDVPISLSVVDDELIEQASITDLADLSSYVPGVSVNNSSESFFMDVRIRGFGSPIANKAFEQPVGLVIDSIPYGRIGYWQGPLFDLDRVEVLRGPQGTLFGKNTTAGLFNVTTKKPTSELTGFVAGELGEIDRRRFEGAVGGPLIAPFVNFRISGLHDERDGFLTNTSAGVVPGVASRLNARGRKAVRAQLGVPDLLGAEVTVGYEHVESASDGLGWEVRSIVQEHEPFFREYDPQVEFEPGNEKGFADVAAFSETDIDTAVANVAYPLGAWEVHAVLGHSVLDQTGLADDDYTPATIIFGAERDSNPQTTVELRIQSPDLAGFLGFDGFGVGPGRTDFVAGFFFQDRDIDDSRLDFSLHVPRAAQLVATDATGVVPPCPACAIDQFEVLTTRFEQSSRSFAGFSHLDWRFAERWTLEYGMRFTQEEKEASWATEFSEGTGAGWVALLNAEEFTAGRDRSEFAFTPKVTLAWDWTEAINVYAGWGTGFKSGGFNATVFNDDTEGGLSYDPEKAASWELGTKTELLDGAAALNVGLFRQTATDLQVFSVTSNTELLVQNAGKARSQGVETDLTWLPSEWLTVRGTLAFTDAEYLEFPFGGCPADREDSDGDGDSRCDLSGRPLQFTPKWTTTVTPLIRHPVASIPGLGRIAGVLAGADLNGMIAVEYNDVHYVNENLDPRERQPSFLRLNGAIGIGNPAQGWSLRLVGQNLTDEDTVSRIQQVTVVGRSYLQLPDPPRLFFGELRWDF